MRLLARVDKSMAETWPAYVFLAFLVLLGCCCGGSIGLTLGALIW